MYAIAEDLEQAIKSIDLDRLVVVEEAVEYPGELVFQLVRGEQVQISPETMLFTHICGPPTDFDKSIDFPLYICTILLIMGPSRGLFFY